MALITIPNTFSVGAVIIASQHNSNFSTISTDYNGNIQNVNIAANAAIVDSKLANITTASKVSGAALTSLGSTPSGAGIIPTANLGSGTANSTKVLTGASTYVNPSTLTGLGAWGTISTTSATIIQAATDGFVIYNTINGIGITVYTDSSNPPTTARVTVLPSASESNFAICPIKKTDYYKGTTSSGSFTTAFFIPLGS